MEFLFVLYGRLKMYIACRTLDHQVLKYLVQHRFTMQIIDLLDLGLFQYQIARLLLGFICKYHIENIQSPVSTTSLLFSSLTQFLILEKIHVIRRLALIIHVNELSECRMLVVSFVFLFVST